MNSFSLKIDDCAISSCTITNGNIDYNLRLNFLEYIIVYAVCNLSRNYAPEISWSIKKFIQEVTNSLK